MTEDNGGPRGPLLLLLGHWFLHLTQLPLHQGREALPQLRPGRVQPLHQHGGGAQPGHP